MSARGNDNSMELAGRTGKNIHKKRKRRFYSNVKSYVAMVISVSMLFTSVDCISVRAEELADIGLPVLEEEKPDSSGAGEITKGEPVDGPATIISFQELSEEDSCIKLTGEKKALDDVLGLMPETLTANVEPAGSVSENTPEDDTKPGEGETEPGEEEQPGSDETEPGEEVQPGAGDSDSQDVPDSGNGGSENAGADDGSGSDTGKEGQDSGSSGGESHSKDSDANDVAAAAKSGTFAKGGQRWRLLVETGENSEDPVGNGEDGSGDSGENDSGTEGSTGGNGDSGESESGSDGNEGGGDGEGGQGADGPQTGEGENPPDIEAGDGKDIPAAEEPDTVLPADGDASETVEIPVTWNCESYGTEESDSYIFVPEWDETKWSLAESGKDTVPAIEVAYVVPESEVSTEEELVAAFAAGCSQIMLTEDIFLTKTLYLPTGVDIILDGCGYSLLRGKVTEEGETAQSGETFSGIMIAMDGEGYTEDTYGTLTLKDITVNGGTEADRAGAPAILDRGNLILDEGAVVRNNYNYGTYPKEGEDEKEAVPDYGGGIQVYGELTLSPDVLVADNFADEFGGGVYLAEGATLYLYADVIADNRVGEGHGYGADLYAAPGSVIYYDPSVDMDREGFYICKGAILIPMGTVQVDLPVDDRKEVYISVSEDSGYSEEEVAALKARLEELGYTIISNRRISIDTTDLRNWYVYDHYDTKYWTSVDGNVTNPKQA